MAPEGRRLALIIASCHFTDNVLQQLIAPGEDAVALERVLKDPAIGWFETKALIDRPSNELRAEIEAFFSTGKREDLLLLYFSGHGLKNDDGKLYLATIDTRRNLPLSTTVEAGFINENMLNCRSRSQVLILDCCHSGAFARGMKAGGVGDSVDIGERFEGGGRVVLTASNAIQYAFEGDKITGERSYSVFTRYLVRGLETGEADLDRDGRIKLDELYNYVYDCVKKETPHQTPGMWAFQVEGDLVLARSKERPPPENSEEAMVAQRYSQALAALTNGHWRESLSHLESIAAKRPSYRDAEYRLTALRQLAAETQRLGPSRGGWRLAVYRFPIVAALLVALLPNALASILNYTYNRKVLVQGHENREMVFDITAAIVNATGFLVGTTILYLLAASVAHGLRRLQSGEKVLTEDLRLLRWRCLYLGHLAACLGISLWTIAGPVYPVGIGYWGDSMSVRESLYFIVSLCLGGLIAAAYPFFGLTILCTRVLYLPLVEPGSTTSADQDWLERLERFTWLYLSLAASVPMLALTLALLVDRSSIESALLSMLSLSGLVGFALVSLLCRALQRDLELLKHLVIRSRPGKGEGLLP